MRRPHGHASLTTLVLPLRWRETGLSKYGQVFDDGYMRGTELTTSGARLEGGCANC